MILQFYIKKKEPERDSSFEKYCVSGISVCFGVAQFELELNRSFWRYEFPTLASNFEWDTSRYQDPDPKNVTSHGQVRGVFPKVKAPAGHFSRES